ncbi:hypothetical protein NNC19_02060 [Clostridium sp. SHJSY1]|uniref:hypothetical protein n=1 Tax=Clostridium sp. SHJSY1 TaxID=2942483 RepID=UPI002876DED7|nr:hypothetical protein [Clostridium sp. SHJSY1]MDS0524444.1 hypothetical protein [Clostridium sp. SHJSY1]
MIDDIKMAISANNLQKARRILKDEFISRDYPREVFKDALDLAESYDVFEEHDNEKFLPDSKDWTNDYLQDLKDALDDNFSKERFMHAYTVARKLDKMNKANKLDSYNISVYDHYKDFVFRAQVGTAIITIAAVGIGALLYKKHKKK